RKRPSKRPAALPDDPHPLPVHATVSGATYVGRCESLDAEKPAPTIGMFEALAVSVGVVQPHPPETDAFTLAVWAEKFAEIAPVTDGVPVAPGYVLKERFGSTAVNTRLAVPVRGSVIPAFGAAPASSAMDPVMKSEKPLPGVRFGFRRYV